MPPPSLSVAIVTHRTPAETLGTALRSLAAAVAQARSRGALGAVRVHVIDNGEGDSLAWTRSAAAAWPGDAGELRLHAGHGNLGYARANNLVLPLLDSDFHLVMNPDVELAAASLAESLAAMREHPEVGLVAPDVRDERGARQYLCRRYPSLRALLLRGFAPRALRMRFRALLDDYEMRDVVGDRFAKGIPLASGCFMLLRTPLFARLGGFDPRYFLYFEDYDLSLRLAREAQIAYVPGARIVHHGGEAARKGARHLAWFAASAWRFFRRHGWKV